MQNSIIECKQIIPSTLPFHFQGKGLDLELSAGQIVSFIGSTYSARSHWLKCICGVEQPKTGNIRIHGSDTANFNADDWVTTRMKIAYMHADTALLSAVEGLMNVIIPARYHRLDIKNYNEILTVKALTILEEIDPKLNLHDLPAYVPKEHRFKIAVARALLLEPEVLVINRPFTHFDNDSKIQFQKFLIGLVSNGLSLIIATRDIPFVLNNSDKIIFAAQDNLYLFDSRQEILECDIAAIRQYIKDNT